jgi:hypothetical protein
MLWFIECIVSIGKLRGKCKVGRSNKIDR